MVMECWAIIFVVAMMFFMFFRFGKKEYAFAVSPLVIVPFFYLLGRRLHGWLNLSAIVDEVTFRMGMSLVALVAACVLLGLSSRGVVSPGRRAILLLCSTGFTLVLAWIFLMEILS